MDWKGGLLWPFTVFLSAFLLFQVQPLLAKMILPWFGGSAAVWTTCLLFFQGGLLLGYLYAHGSIRYLPPRAQGILHLCLLGTSLLFLPLLPDAQWKPSGNEDPTVRILLLLLATVGLPYFLLSSTSPLLQAWRARTLEDDAGPGGATGRSTYRLYALSNAGSMLALLTYPTLVEPGLETARQSFFWSAGYGLFALLCAGTVVRSWSGKSLQLHAGEELEMEEAERPGAERMALWLTLSFCSSALLLAITAHLSHNVAPIPFLWVLPLGLYLLSFILCFESEWKWHPVALALPPLGFAALAYALSATMKNAGPKALLQPLAAGFFICCFVCHGELSRTRPHPRHLTLFYLLISLGGALGGLFVALVAPRLFNDNYELPLSVGLCALLAFFRLYRAPFEWRHPVPWIAGFATLLLLYDLFIETRKIGEGYHRLERNFYGVLRVSDSDSRGKGQETRVLTDGSILHGEQFLAPKLRMEPTTYYHRKSGVGLALLEARKRPRLRVGVIGLGTGTLAAYARPGDVYRFYEINPNALRMARTEFSCLNGSKGTVEVALGDARLSLEREQPQQFDVLVVDAFSSDAIPAHLLTKEAFDLYFRHLKRDGVLAVHLSNQYLDLTPIVGRAAQALKKQARLVDSWGDLATAASPATWALITARTDFFIHPTLLSVVTPIIVWKDTRIWTDDYNNLYELLK